MSPSRNSESIIHDRIRLDYEFAKTSRYRRRRKGVASLGASADYHTRDEGLYLRGQELARDMDRNDMMVGSIINRATDNILQGGIPPTPETGDEDLDDYLEGRWAEWSIDPESCDIQGEATFLDLEYTALRDTFVAGDIVPLFTEFGALELIEAHRVRTPSNTKRNVVLGILMDGLRRRLEYWITKDDISPTTAVSKVSDITPVPVRDREGDRQLSHLYFPKRVSQTRGVTALAPIVDPLAIFDDVNFARLVQQQVVSCFGIFRRREASYGGAKPAKLGSESTEVRSDGSTKVIQGLQPGFILEGEPGEVIDVIQPNVPNPEFFQHVRFILQIIGVNLGLPLIYVLMDAAETNFSGWRGAADQAKIGFQRIQRAMISRFHLPIWRWKAQQFIDDDAAARRVAQQQGIKPLGVRFNPPTWPYIQPIQDARADQLRIEHWLTSRRRQQAERGRQWTDVSQEIVDDNALIIGKAHEKAQELNKLDASLQLTWRDVLKLGDEAPVQQEKESAAGPAGTRQDSPEGIPQRNGDASHAGAGT